MLVALKVLAVLTFISYKQTNQQTPNCEYIYRLNDFRVSKGFFPSGNFSRVCSQVTTSQKCNFPSGNFPSLPKPQRSAPQTVLAATLGPLAIPSPNAASGASEGLK